MNNYSKIFFVTIYFLTCISLFSHNNSKFMFLENKGQLINSVISKCKLPGGELFVEKGKLIYAFYNQADIAERHNGIQKTHIKAHSFSINFMNFNKNTMPFLSKKSQYFENFYNNQNWIENVHLYEVLQMQNIYKNIDMYMYKNNGHLKYDFVVKSGANVKDIKMRYSGQENIRIENKKLVIYTSVNVITELKPYAYQVYKGDTIVVECEFGLKNNIVYFKLPNKYDKSIDLIIDPTLIFSTYSGSTSDNFGYTATYDESGYLYAGSTVFGVGYPTTLGAYEINYSNNNGGTDIGITKYDTSGTYRIYSTYLGGSMDELPHSMIVNGNNELFLYGTTGSNDFPTTSGSYDETFNGGYSFSPSGLGVSFPNGSDVFISRLSSNGGNLLASTYIGGTNNDGLNVSSKLRRNYADEVRGEIDIDNQNNIYLATCTYSADFPVTNSYQQQNNGGQEGCIVKMDNQLSSIIWSSYLGGRKDDAIYSLALDSDNNLFVTGGTNSDDFPVSANAYENTYLDSIQADAFIAHVSSNGNSIINSTYFGSNKYDQSYFVELNKNEEVYIFGQTKSSGNSLINNASYFQLNGNQFVAIFSNKLDALIRSTIFGTGKGSPDISPTAFLVDVCHNIYMSGWGSNTGNGALSTLNMPITNNAFQSTTDGNDFYIMILDDNLDSLIYGTYFGGSQSAEHVDGGTSRFDKKGVIYQSVCAGCGNNNDFPIKPDPGAVSTTNNSNNCNNGVFKFDFDLPILISNFEVPLISCNNTISFLNTTNNINNTSFWWDFGDGYISTNLNPTHQYANAGFYNVKLIATNNNTCNITDTIVKQIYLLGNTSTYLSDIIACKNETLQIGVSPSNMSGINYSWLPTYGLSDYTVPNPIVNIDSSILYKLVISDGVCADTIYQKVNIDNISINLNQDTSFCKDPIMLIADTMGLISSIIWSSNNDFTDTISQGINYLAENIGIYYVMSNNDQCSAIDSINVNNNDIQIDITGITAICVGDSVFIKAIDISENNPISSYNWESEYSLSFNDDSSSFIAFPDSSTYFSLLATNTLGCFIRDSIFVSVSNYPIYDSIWAVETSIYLGEFTNLNVSTDNNILWSNGDSTFISTVNPEVSTMYYANIYNDHCVIIDSIYITVKDVFCDISKLIIPNAFSPNEDNINDKYQILDLDGIITDFNLQIFNRYGEAVYCSNNVHEVWDGYYKGKLLSTQVFDYFIEIKCVGNKEFFQKGNITLIR